MPKVRFLLDEHISKAVAKGLRGRGIEVLTVAEAGMLSFADPEIMAFAHRENRVMVTQDDDFLVHHENGVPHAGIAFASRPLGIGQFVAGLLLIHEVLDAGDMAGHVEYL